MTRTLTILILVLFLATLASIAVLLSLVTQPPIVFAVVLLLAVFGVLFATLIATNVRRPRGIDPDALPRPAILYGRREDDDRDVTEQLSEVLERAAAKRPASARTPDWFISERKDSSDAHSDAAAMFPDVEDHS